MNDLDVLEWIKIGLILSIISTIFLAFKKEGIDSLEKTLIDTINNISSIEYIIIIFCMFIFILISIIILKINTAQNDIVKQKSNNLKVKSTAQSNDKAKFKGDN